MAVRLVQTGIALNSQGLVSGVNGASVELDPWEDITE